LTDQREFKATSDQMLDLIDRLRTVEQAKQTVGYGSAEFVELATEAEKLSRLAFRWSGLQLQMAEAATSAVARGEVSGAPASEVSPRPLDRILAAWREAQLRFEISRPGSAEAAAAADAIERLREEYRAVEEAKFAAAAEGDGHQRT
jgi:hypothetical protein